MRRIYFLAYLFLISQSVKSQGPENAASPQVSLSTDPKYNAYGYLLNDDPEYKRRRNWIRPASHIILTNTVTWTIDRFVIDQSYSRVNPETWSHNLKNGFEWDSDQLRVNFLGHPYSGNQYFSAARSNGYSYVQSIPFCAYGSLMWEYFGETTRPSFNDLINTTVSGAFLGEIFYRLGSNILNDKLRGRPRLLREVSVAILSPARAFSRLTRGKTFSITDKEVYQQEPLNISLSGGIHKVNNGSDFGSGSNKVMFNMQLDYGDPFEIRSRKPFDVFRLKMDLTFAPKVKVPYRVMGYGILSGKNSRRGKKIFLTGLFQHYDYWNNKNFQVASSGFGAGLISKLPIAGNSDFYSSLHIGFIPLAGINSLAGVDTSKYRNYNYGGGVQGKLETTLNINRCVSISLNGYYYWIHSYVKFEGEGSAGNSMLTVINPKLSLWLSKTIGLGFEQFVFCSVSYSKESSAVQNVHTEQKVFLQLFLQNIARKGSRYN
jgi:hypothetical protein